MIPRRRPRFLPAVGLTTAFVLSVTTTLAWAWTGGVQQLGLPFEALGDPTVAGSVPGWSPAAGPVQPAPGTPAAPATTTTTAQARGAGGAAPAAPATNSTHATPGNAASAAGGGVTPRAAAAGNCHTGAKLVPTCGVLWGVAPGAFTDVPGATALATFERKTGRHQDIYHAYHQGIKQLFPTPAEIAIARQPGRERLLLINWKKPYTTSWAKIAKGDPATDAFLDRLAVHINSTFREPFFFTVHHEGEDNVRPRAGSGYTAKDYAAMYRHVVLRLRAHGVTNLVTVLVHMAYVPHTTWFDDMYPGDDVVDWIGMDSYSYADPGYGHGDFTEMLNRQSSARPTWPGFYAWAARKHPTKPLMVAEWGVWASRRNPTYQAAFYRAVGAQISRFPRIRAMVYFETPHNQDKRDSRVDSTPASLAAYRWLGSLPTFQVAVRN
ncbi:glycoside hydrolase family 26 protein [Krasilnikovia sp. MM14-A1259]|uniref:glycoside hydrolase family 26 protein n=1 Tax=Krasilnikovia sp. MM14-A1259 TaxID=3373539 RepID=UPI00399C94A2